MSAECRVFLRTGKCEVRPGQSEGWVRDAAITMPDGKVYPLGSGATSEIDRRAQVAISIWEASK